MPVAAEKIRACRVGGILKAKAKRKGEWFSRIYADRDVVDFQIERHAEIIALAENGPERLVEITVGLRRIPGDVEILVR